MMKSLKIFGSLFLTFSFLLASCSNVDEPKKDDDDEGKKELTVLLTENFGEELGTTAPTGNWPMLADYTDFQKEGKGAAEVAYASEGGLVTVRGNQPSKDYEGASGSGNVLLAAAGGSSMTVKNLAVCGAKVIDISFGTTAETETMDVYYRVSGLDDWHALSFEKEGDTWDLVEIKEITLPAGANTINLKFVGGQAQHGTRIDDLKVTTYDVTGEPVVDVDSGSGGDGTGGGTECNPYDVDAAMANQGKVAWVEGYIVGTIEGLSFEDDASFAAPFETATNLLLADEDGQTIAEYCLPVQLPTGSVRNGLSLVTNPGNLGKKVKLYGSLEAYFRVPGLKKVTYFEIEGGASGGTKPVEVTDAFLNESLTTQTSFGKFTAFSVKGDQKWTMDASYGAVMSGYAGNRSYENEDWFISPAMNLAGKSDVKLTFNHARGPAGEITTGVSEGWYTVWVSNDYSSGNPNDVTWTELTGITHGTTAWGYVSSGAITIPAANLKANARIAFKYLCTDEKSATWEVKDVVVQ